MSQPMQDAEAVAPAPAPHEYHQLLRGPRYGWWRPPLAIGLALGLIVGAFFLLGLASFLFGFDDQLDALLDTQEMSPGAFALGNLVIAGLIPACLIATRVVHRVRAGLLSSVAGRFRWNWFLRCCALLVPVYAAYVALDLLLDPPESSRHMDWALLLLLVLATTPLQAAGEEYLFRGMILQNIGGSFRNAAFGLAIAAIVSVLVFASAHGSADPWIFLDLAVFGAACCVLAWRTGGIEAPIALHVINNVLGMCGSLLIGGWEEGFVDETSQGKPLDLLLTLLACGVIVPLMLRLATRHGIARAAPA
jgi:membrane protease YdiL (CAAX protease family)